MKKWKKVVALVLSGVMCAGLMSGCGGGNKASNSATDIEIKIWQAGLGVEWLDKVIEGFEKKYPEYNVEYTATADAAAVIAAYGMEDVDTTDLYFCLQSSMPQYNEPLNDVLDSTAEGESKTIREKFDPAYLALDTNADGNVYSLTWGGGVSGIIYNTELFEQAGISELPRTTDELAVMCDTIYRKGITPLGHHKRGGYWPYMTEVFAMQYDGFDYYMNKFYACVDENGESPSINALKAKDGRYQTLKAYEQIIQPNYVLSGSNSQEHTMMQTQFVNGACAMMVNGSWMANEMSGEGMKDTFTVMKTPVLSSLTDKLATVTKESELCKVVSAVDAVTDGEKTVDDYKDGEDYVVDGLKVSAADWDVVYAARNTVAANYSGHGAYIPKYSTAKEGAKEFLKYLYSDEGYAIYTNELHLALPLTPDSGEIDTTSWTNFEKGQFALLKSAVQFASKDNASRHAIFVDGGAADLFADQDYIQYLCTQNAGDRLNADEIWEKHMAYIDSNYEINWLANIK